MNNDIYSKIITLIFIIPIIFFIKKNKNKYMNLSIFLTIFQIFYSFVINKKSYMFDTINSIAYSIGQNIYIILAFILTLKSDNKKNINTHIKCRVCEKNITNIHSINGVCSECHQKILKKIESKKY